MDKQLRDELIRTTFEKLLLAVAAGLIIAFGTYEFSRSTEHYKAVENKRAEGVSTFVDATTNLWARAYAYEDAVNALMTKQDEEAIFNDHSRTQEIQLAQSDVKAALEAFDKEAAQKRPIIGEMLATRFEQYVGFVNCRADAHRMARGDVEEFSRRTGKDAEIAFTKMIQQMRFDAKTSREMAIAALQS